jgi:uncharacterized protein (DUF58 family)
MMERRLCEEASYSPVTIVLDARAPASEEALDRAVRAAASLCAGLARAGGCSLLLPGRPGVEALGPDLAGWERLHELLALVAPEEAPHWQLAHDSRRIVLVQARHPQAPPAVRISCSVSPVPDARSGVLFNVAGCAVQPVARVVAERAA